MLQETVLRLRGVKSISSPVVVGNEGHRFLAAEQLRQVGVDFAAILLEPVGRNTAPAVAIAALATVDRGFGRAADGESPLLLVLPSDHAIQDVGAFEAAISVGARAARAGQLVTFGVKPERPDSGYGYIRKAAPKNGDCEGAYAVGGFVEKPDIDTARRYVESGEYLWNSGIFIFDVERYLEEMKRFAPKMLECCKESYANARDDLGFTYLDPEAFAACDGDSIDYTIMEKTEKAVVVPLDAGWSDLGSWSALHAASSPDEDANVFRGDVSAKDTRGSFVHAENRLVVAVALENLVVVETADAVLVAPMDHARNLTAAVAELKASGREEVVSNREVHRPWGSYDSIDSGEGYQVKRLTVTPGAKLSLQKHHHRAEHWVVVRGTAEVTVGDETFFLEKNQSTYIPAQTVHRLANPGTTLLEVIEVQSGSYLGEDDIVRFEDTYGRSGE